MKHPNVILSIQSDLDGINNEISKFKPTDVINRKKHEKAFALKAEFEHGLRIIRLMDDF